MAKGLKIVLPSAVSDPEGKLRKLEHYYGIEFVRGSSDGGSSKGYYRLIGDDSLRSEMRFHNQIKLANVKDGNLQYIYNQLNLNLTADGAAATVDGADGSDVMQIHQKTVYAIVGGSNATYERFIVSDAPFTYDGDVAIEFDPYGECPDYMTYDSSNKARSIYGSNGIGSSVAGYGYDFSGVGYNYGETAGFPRTYVSRWGYEGAARAKNSSASSNIPYTIVYNRDIELAAAFMFIEARTKVLTNVFGYGLSSDAAPAAATWGTCSGVRYSYDGGTTWSYAALNMTAFNVKSKDESTSAATQGIWQVINQYYPLTQVLEAQMAVSADNTKLTAISDTDGNVIGEGTMTGIYTKTFSFKAKFAPSSTGTTAEATVEVCFRIPMWRGRSRMWGNLTQWYGGYECVTSRASESDPIVYEIYRALKEEDLVTDQTYSVASGSTFGFESTYQKVATISAPVNGWCTSMLNVSGVTTAIGVAGAASISNYENAYVYYGGPDVVGGTRYRKGSLLGDLAHSAIAVLRIAGLGNAPSYAASYFGSAFRVTLQNV